MAQDNSLFDQINNLWTKEKRVSTETKAESIYMISRFLSLTQDGFLAAMDLNQIHKAPEWCKLPYLYYALPQQAVPRNKYPKIEKVKITPRRQRALDRICKKFCVLPFHGLQIITLLEKQGIQVEAD